MLTMNRAHSKDRKIAPGKFLISLPTKAEGEPSALYVKNDGNHGRNRKFLKQEVLAWKRQKKFPQLPFPNIRPAAIKIIRINQRTQSKKSCSCPSPANARN
jgi:hypothetical protein